MHSGGDVLVPNIAGWRHERVPALPQAAWFDLSPEWACEVVSPETGLIDRVRKMPIYARWGVSHAWLVDPIGRTLEVFRLESGKEGSVHLEQVLEYNQDPRYLRDMLIYRLTFEAQKRMQASPLSRREIIRRLGTSAAQLYRLLDQTNYRKSLDQLTSLLQVLDCDVDIVVRAKTA